MDRHVGDVVPNLNCDICAVCGETILCAHCEMEACSNCLPLHEEECASRSVESRKMVKAIVRCLANRVGPYFKAGRSL